MLSRYLPLIFASSCGYVLSNTIKFIDDIVEVTGSPVSKALIAADVNSDNKISALDYIAIKNAIMK